MNADLQPLTTLLRKINSLKLAQLRLEAHLLRKQLKLKSTLTSLLASVNQPKL